MSCWFCCGGHWNTPLIYNWACNRVSARVFHSHDAATLQPALWAKIAQIVYFKYALWAWCMGPWLPLDRSWQPKILTNTISHENVPLFCEVCSSPFEKLLFFSSSRCHRPLTRRRRCRKNRLSAINDIIPCRKKAARAPATRASSPAAPCWKLRPRKTRHRWSRATALKSSPALPAANATKRSVRRDSPNCACLSCASSLRSWKTSKRLAGKGAFLFSKLVVLCFVQRRDADKFFISCRASRCATEASWLGCLS